MADIEKTRAVVEANETYDGKLIPTVQAELGRPVRIREGATVQGGVYGETIDVDSDGTVEGSVMASDAIELSDCHVQGEVGSPGKVVCDGVHVEGTVTGQRVRLTDCIVRGNVVGAQVILENCIVLGITTSDEELTIEDSLCYTFRARGSTTLMEVTTILPQVIADGPLDLQTPVSVAGLGPLDTGTNDDGQDLPQMTDEDRYVQNDRTYLTLAPRILNLEKVTDRLEELEAAIMEIVADMNGEGPAEIDIDVVLSSLDIDQAGFAVD
ncbi:polymer-forming cytoskeletal protein [Halorientalis halophila]|uniref:polymer-forming cytoskeletal protein n=1 Tax=Halorientalis halophila TaxID=3108499 RepID=UPI0030090081